MEKGIRNYLISKYGSLSKEKYIENLVKDIITQKETYMKANDEQRQDNVILKTQLESYKKREDKIREIFENIVCGDDCIGIVSYPDLKKYYYFKCSNEVEELDLDTTNILTNSILSILDNKEE